MVKISTKNCSVTISCGAKEDFLKNENNRIFLESCGQMYGSSSERKKNKEFEITTDADRVDELIYELKEYFGTDVKDDQSVINVYAQKELSEKEYENYRKIGNQIRSKKGARNELFSAKKGFKLKPYQERTVAHFINIPNTANFSIPGAGKTIMTYAGFYILKQKKN